MIHGVQKIVPANVALDGLSIPPWGPDTSTEKVYNPVVGIAINKPVKLYSYIH
jgi:hypothetical protein